MAHPIPTHTSQKPGDPWPEVWVNMAWQTPIVLLFVVAGGVAGLVPTLFVWMTNGAIEAGTLLFWCKWGVALGLILGGWLCAHNALNVWIEARGGRIRVDPAPFEDAAWAAFRAWLEEGGHRRAHADGCTTLTFLAPWQVADGDAVARYGPLFETEGVQPQGVSQRSGSGVRLAWIPNDAAVPNARARRAYSQQKSGHVAVRIGPFSVGTAHGLLALEHIVAPKPAPAPTGTTASGPSD
jgi:hypothetical protein